MVDFPTRGPNILDTFLTNRPCLVKECSTISGISDHKAVLVMSAVIAQLLHPPKRFIYLWTQADLNLIRENIQYLCEEFTTMYTSATPVVFYGIVFCKSVITA